MRWSVAGFVAAGALGACLFPDLSALRGDASDGGANDVVTDASDAGEDGPPSDAAASPCVASHTFCDDFDENPLGAKWDTITSQVGPLVLSSDAISPPNALEATIMSGAFGNSMLVKTMHADAHFHVEADLRVDAPAITSGTEIDLVELSINPVGYDDVDIVIDRVDKASVVEVYTHWLDGGTTSADTPFNEDFSSWKHVTMDIDLSKQVAIVDVDGKQVASVSLPSYTASPVMLAVGATYASTVAGTWHTHIDNVTYDAIQ